MGWLRILSFPDAYDRLLLSIISHFSPLRSLLSLSLSSVAFALLCTPPAAHPLFLLLLPTTSLGNPLR
jgi:hypothetical protein